MSKPAIKLRSQTEPKLRTAPMKQVAVLQMRLAGESERKIARDLGIGRNTVTRILSQSEVKALQERALSDLYSLLADAVETYRTLLASHDNLTAATNILNGLQVFQSRSHRKVSTLRDEELERRDLAGRSKEELDFFGEHCCFPEDYERLGKND